jgi:hypothetical protein
MTQPAELFAQWFVSFIPIRYYVLNAFIKPEQIFKERRDVYTYWKKYIFICHFPRFAGPHTIESNKAGQFLQQSCSHTIQFNASFLSARPFSKQYCVRSTSHMKNAWCCSSLTIRIPGRAIQVCQEFANGSFGFRQQAVSCLGRTQWRH